MYPQPYPLFARWNGLNWRVIGWEEFDPVTPTDDFTYQPVVVRHNHATNTTRVIPLGDDYTLLIGIHGIGEGTDVSDSLYEWQLKWRRKSWSDNHQCGNHYQTLKGITNATGDLLRKPKPGDPLDRLSVLRRRVGPWERQPLTDYTQQPTPPEFTDPDPRYQRKHNDEA